MLMWIKPNDQFGESLWRTLKRLTAIAFVVGVLLGTAVAASWGMAWVAIKTAITPVVRWGHP